MPMDVREYYDDVEEVARVAGDNVRKRLWTAVPVIVDEDSADGHTVKVKIAVKARVRNEKGKLEDVEIDTLQDVPVHFVGGGGGDDTSIVHTHPIKKGDEGIIIFGMRGHSHWHKDGGVQSAITDRMHSLSDAMYVPGIRSDPRKIKNVNMSVSQMRSVDGKHYSQLDPKSGSLSFHIDAKKPKKDEEPMPAGTHNLTLNMSTKKEEKGKGQLSVNINADSDKHNMMIDGIKGLFNLHLFDGKHKVAIDGKKNTFTISINNGKHKITIDDESGIGLHTDASVQVNSADSMFVNSPTMSLQGGLNAMKAISSKAGFAAPLISAILGAVSPETDKKK